MAAAEGMFFRRSFQVAFHSRAVLWNETLAVQKAFVKSVNFSMMYLFFSQKIAHSPSFVLQLSFLL